MSANFDYYKVEFKLIREMLGTLAETSITHEHVTKNAMKAIKKANREGARLSKSIEKYYGAEIADEKLIAEIKATIATFSELTGKLLTDLPNDPEELLEIAKEMEEEYHAKVKSKELRNATVFMRRVKEDYKYKTWPIISTHMVVGNLKAIATVITNVSTLKKESKMFQSKIAVKEALSLDIKPIEYFMDSSHDIRRWDDGAEEMVEWPEGASDLKEPGTDRKLMERPIRFERNGKETTSISISERLPVGTTFGCTLRVRKNSVLTEAALNELFDYGKNLGFGKWRSVGNMGAYKYKLVKLDDFDETDADGFK